MRMICCWAGCTESYKIRGRMPEGWRSLTVYWAETVPVVFTEQGPALLFNGLTIWDRDGMLCPLHAKGLEQLLKPLTADTFGPRMRGQKGH